MCACTRACVCVPTHVPARSVLGNLRVISPMVAMHEVHNQLGEILSPSLFLSNTHTHTHTHTHTYTHLFLTEWRVTHTICNQYAQQRVQCGLLPSSLCFHPGPKRELSYFLWAQPLHTAIVIFHYRHFYGSINKRGE